MAKMSVSEVDADVVDSGDSAVEEGDFVHIGGTPSRGGLTSAERLIARQLRAAAARKQTHAVSCNTGSASASPSAPAEPSLI